MKYKKKIFAVFLLLVLTVQLTSGYAPRRADAADTNSDKKTYEFTKQMIAMALAELGHDYVSGQGYQGNGYAEGTTFDCTGLLYNCLQNAGAKYVYAAAKSGASPSMQAIPTGSWFWAQFCKANEGKTVMFYKNKERTDDSLIAVYQIGKRDAGYINEEPDYLKPGTLFLKSEPDGTDTHNHVGIILGCFPAVADASGADNPTATAKSVAEYLIAEYGKDVETIWKKAGVNKSFQKVIAQGNYRYGTGSNCWDYMSRRADQYDLSGLTAAEKKQVEKLLLERTYKQVWQVDALNTTCGVSVNNQPYGKAFASQVYLFAPVYETTGTLAVKKVDAEGNEISGAYFEVYDDSACTHPIGQAVTRAGQTNYVQTYSGFSKDGTPKLGGTRLELPDQKACWVREIQAPKPYVVSEEIFSVKIVKEQTVFVNGPSGVVNTCKIPLQVVKKDTVTGAVLSGCSFEAAAYDKRTDSYSGTVTPLQFNETKQVYEALVEYTENNQGRFQIRETASDAYHSLSEDSIITFAYSGKETLPLTFTMNNVPTQVEISKTSIVDGAELAGALLQITDDTGHLVKEWVTNGHKTMITAELEVGKIYTLREITAPQGYVKADEVSFTVSEDGTITKVHMVDEPTEILIVKYDDNGMPLAGATLRLLSMTGEVMDEWISDGTGHRLTGKLIVGETYQVQEIEAPEGYLTNQETVVFTVPENGKLKIEFTNQPTTVVIKKQVL